MAILGTVALIVVVILGIAVLRMKNDPMEKESVRRALADAEHRADAIPPKSSPNSGPRA
jgi:uncharacterized membrane-anchored protein YhcB (DUF1043 family)